MPGRNAETGVVGIKLEAVEGVAETITAAECRLLVEEPEFTLDPTMNERRPARPYMGAIAQVPGGISCTMSFRTELKGAGAANLAAGTAPAWGVALRCCGFSESLVAGVMAQYTPNLVGLNIPSATLKLFKDGKQRTMRGARGTCSVETEGNAIQYLSFEFTGVFESEADEAAPTGITYDPTVPPVLLGADYMLLEYHPVTVEVPAVFAVEEILRDAVASNVKLSAALAQQSSALQCKAVRLRLRQLGTPAGHTNGYWITIEGDAAGDPDGIPIATSRYINPDDYPIATAAGGEWVTFIFDTPAALAATTDYHIVLQGDYTESLVNAIAWQAATVAAPDQICKYYDAAWAAVALKNFVFQPLASSLAELIVAGVAWDLGNSVGLRPNINDGEGWQSGWVSQRMAVGNVEPEEELDANRDFLQSLRNVTTYMQRYRLGSEQANTVHVEMPYTQVTGANEWGNREGVMTRPLTLQHNQSSGGDDIIITAR